MFKTIPIVVMAMLCLNFNSRAQSPKTLPLPEKQAILGKVVSSTTGEALPGAVIKIMTLNYTTISNDKGEFILTLSNGAYKLSVTHIGYKTKNLSIQIPIKEQLVITLDTDDAPNNTKEEQLVQSKIIKPLKIGDTIPEAILKLPLQIINHPDGKQFITLNEYKDQLVILDFWATYCKPCIRSIVKLDSIRKDLKDQFSVLPIQVYDKPDRIMPYFKMSSQNWPSIVKDTVLNKIVLSRYITGFGTAWIYKGKLIAVPRQSGITTENILSVLAGRNPVVENLKDQQK